MLRFRPPPLHYPITPPPAASHMPSTLAFSLPKAGSTLLYQILSALAPLCDLTYFSIEDALFQANVKSSQRPTSIGTAFSPHGYCYGGFRQFPAFPVPILHSSKVVLLVRDPRDMLVSLYFSLMYSHSLPTSGEGEMTDAINRTREQFRQKGADLFARESTSDYVKMFEGYIAQGFVWRPNVVIYRYEDVIFNKTAWITDMCAFYGWAVSTEDIARVVKQVDKVPSEERPSEHVRQVTPGNHVHHLSRGTIEFIENRLGEYMNLFQYK